VQTTSKFRFRLSFFFFPCCHICKLQPIPRDHVVFVFVLRGSMRSGNHFGLEEHNTVKPIYNAPVLSGHPLLTGQFSKSRFFAHANAEFFTCIRRPMYVFLCYFYLY